MDNIWDNKPEQENENNLSAPETPKADVAGPQKENDIISAASPSAEAFEEPRPQPEPEQHSYGSYSSYDAVRPVQQPYGGYTEQPNNRPNDYMNPYGAPRQSYTPNAPQPYGDNAPQQQQYRQSYYPYPPVSQPQVENPPQKKKNAGKIVFISLICVAVIAAFIGIGSVLGGSKQANPQQPNTTTATDETQTSNNSRNEGLNIAPTPAGDKNTQSADGKLSPEAVYEKLSKSNVGIVLYGANGNNIIGQGSGIIMSESGYILTCAHVIDANGAKARIRVVLDDNTEYDATIVGYDTRTDIGVIKISPTSALNVAEFGDSNALKVGEQVIAIGNPGGLQFFGSFSDGKVSAIDRPVNSSIGYTMKCIQHTAAISPGNSGGMLVNMYGQVIGINSSKIASTDYEGIGFAIPISSAKSIIDDLIQHGYVTDRAKLGITYSRINENYTYYMTAYNYGMPTGSLVIRSISDDSDIKNYDVQEYDFITAVNGKELQDGSELQDAIENAKPGDEIQLTISRISNKAIQTFNITCKLVQDKGSAAESEASDETENPQQDGNPFGGSGFPFGDGSDFFGDFPF